MRCPFCNTDYTAERPCFCHPQQEPKRTAREEYYTHSSEEEPIALNEDRGARLD